MQMRILLLVLATLGFSCASTEESGQIGAFTMGASGGKLTLSDGAEISVPAGALPGALTIQIENLGESAFPTPSLTPLGSFYRLSPAGQQFSQPVSIFLPFNLGLVGGNTGAVRVFLSSDGGLSFVALPLYSASKSTLVGGQTTHFSIAVAGLPFVGGDGDTLPRQEEGGLSSEAAGGGNVSPYHDGCSNASTPGCGGCSCEAAVCSVSSECCSSLWSDSCAQLCAQLDSFCAAESGESTEGGEESSTEGGAIDPEASCAGICNNQAPSGCFCDAACIPKGDCCEDACTICGLCEGTCGDGACLSPESCESCPSDCGGCEESCGDGSCLANESCENCPADCGECVTEGGCGDGSCTSGETCQSCPTDCGPCSDVCGDGTCGPGESCLSCELDCCEPYCGDMECNGAENCSNCSTDCGNCSADESCENHCNEAAARIGGCYCDPTCINYGDCCPDACVLCSICGN